MGMLLKPIVLPTIYPWFDPGPLTEVPDEEGTSDQNGDIRGRIRDRISRFSR